MKSFAVWIVAAAVGLLVGCNTIKGVGQDLQKAGSKIEDVAKKN